MPGLFIVAHAPLASALKECASHVYAGCPQKLLALDVAPDAVVEDTAQAALPALRQAAADGSALVLVDVFGATPSNIAAQLAVADRAMPRDMMKRAATRTKLRRMCSPMLLRT